jgi:serine/threonine protein kinase
MRPNMTSESDAKSIQLALLWCERQGSGWALGTQLGKGGTAPVFEVESPEGPRALKIYDESFSTGEKGEIERKRIGQQLALKGHDCSSLVQVYDGGTFEGRHYLLMARAPGRELEKSLSIVPRDKIRQILDQVARAALFLKSRNLCHRDIKSANVFISDDFNHATLLDISVIRDIEDPVGVGTDHDGQLPVVATARYSPPEYLFRLLEPSAELWHALNIYQMGALLHDLIMKEPLFESEFLLSAENRYRFAWIVATTAPKIQAIDVDQDLVFLAGRALDKDWVQRSCLALDDFLSDANVQRAHALQLLGLAGEKPTAVRSEDRYASNIERIRNVARGLDEAISQRLRADGATAVHVIKPGGDDNSKLLTFAWDAPTSGIETSSGAIELRITISIENRFGGARFKNSVQLLAMIEGEQRQAAMGLPEVEDSPETESLLTNQLYSALADLSLQLGQARII